MARIDSHNPRITWQVLPYALPTSPETASPAELAEALIQITLHCPSAFDATLRACAKQLDRVALAEAQAESWKQLQAGIAALFNGVKP